MFRTSMVATLAGVFAIGGLAFSANAATQNAGKELKPNPSVMVFNQNLRDDKVEIEYLYLPADGYVAIYSGPKDGGPTGEPVGYAKLPAGAHSDIKVGLSTELKSGERLWASLYKNGDTHGTFAPGSGDKPLWAKDELPVENMFVIQ